jgi:hypothetical protein
VINYDLDVFKFSYTKNSLYLNSPYCLKLNGTHQLLVYVDDNILGGNVHTVGKHIEAL